MYSKIFSSMFDGTLATSGNWEALVTFQQILILADADGMCDMTPEAISRRTTIPLDIIQRGIVELEKPDDASRSPAENGRRILRIDPARAWGWTVVNHAKYRGIRNHDDRREYMRKYMQERRATIPESTAAGKPTGKSRGRPPKATESPIQFPEWLDRDQFARWIDARPARARSKAAQEAAIAKLATWKAKGHVPNEIVSTSLANGWQGIFEPNKNTTKTDSDRLVI